MQFLCTVAGNKTASDRAQLRHFAAAALCDAGAARVKSRAAGQFTVPPLCFSAGMSCSCVMASRAEVTMPIFCTARGCVFSGI